MDFKGVCFVYVSRKWSWTLESHVVEMQPAPLSESTWLWWAQAPTQRWPAALLYQAIGVFVVESNFAMVITKIC